MNRLFRLFAVIDAHISVVAAILGLLTLCLTTVQLINLYRLHRYQTAFHAATGALLASYDARIKDLEAIILGRNSK